MRHVSFTTSKMMFSKEEIAVKDDKTKDELKKDAIKVETALNDNELEQVTGGLGHRREFCSCFVPIPDGNGFCNNCGREILK